MFAAHFSFLFWSMQWKHPCLWLWIDFSTCKYIINRFGGAMSQKQGRQSQELYDVKSADTQSRHSAAHKKAMLLVVLLQKKVKSINGLYVFTSNQLLIEYKMIWKANSSQSKICDILVCTCNLLALFFYHNHNNIQKQIWVCCAWIQCLSLHLLNQLYARILGNDILVEYKT